jgi:hypothetical protein
MPNTGRNAARTPSVIKGVDAGGRDPDQDPLRFRNRIRLVEELLDLRAAELAEPERLTHLPQRAG